jgi:hypothetical protein
VIGRILRIELRRSNARWMALLLLPAAVTYGEAGRGLTVLALDQRQSLVAAFPLAMGLAAWHARRERRSRMDELLATTARPRWQRMLPAAAAPAIGALTAYLVGIAVAFGLVLAAGGYLSALAAPIFAVGALGLLVPVALGLVLGRWLPFILVPPVVVIVFFLFLFFGDTEAYTEGPDASGEPPGRLLLWIALQVAGTPFDLAGVTARTHLGQVLWVVALVAAGLIVFASASRRARATSILVVALGAAAALPVLPDRYADAYYLDPDATEPVCTADAPQVCVLRAHRRALTDLRQPARDALAILAAKLPNAPTSVVEIPDPYGAPLPPARAESVYIVLWPGGDGRDTRPAADITWTLLAGAGTTGCANAPAFGTPERRRYETARIVAAAWLLDQEPPAPANPDNPALPRRDETLPAYQALRAWPPDEQRARVAALREAELTCPDTDRLDILIAPR